MRYIVVRNKYGVAEDKVVPSIRYIRKHFALVMRKGHRLTELRRFGRFDGFICNKCNKVYLK